MRKPGMVAETDGSGRETEVPGDGQILMSLMGMK